ncbi:MAG: phosphoribosylaminoimidazolesuccinocarboxamide synthase [Candidatus Omnitrophica bacterium]|nr:phosphoribosylaminoimidazolesuccinocarboxamide synthase [Candidatus Omnitrophota bacterium]
MTTSAARIETVWETKLPLPLVGRGKVRDIYAVGGDRLLIVTTDRLSAFDVVLPDPIPFKGKVLTQISVFWFDHLKSIVPNHLITAEVDEMNLPAEVKEKFGSLLEGRSMLVRRAQPLSVECVIRGYLTGSGWKDYLKTGATSGHKLPAGLQQCQKLSKPIFTPATKAVTGHDENISFEETVSRIGEGTARKVEALSLGLYERGRDYAETKGILIADTKFEFGLIKNEIVLIDEALTPDSSRFWPKEGYGPGRDQPSFDKQIVRNYLLTLTWNQKPPGPKLPAEVIEKTSRAYREIYRRLTGKEVV